MEQLKEALKSLKPEELEQIKQFLNEEVGESTQEENTETEAKDTEESNEPVSDENASADDGTEETVTESTQEEKEPSKDSDGITDEEVDDSANYVDDTPAMQKGFGDEKPNTESSEEDSKSDNVEQSNDSLNELKEVNAALQARIKTLEGELSTLRSKVEGAFGYSSKSSAPGKVNPLYDDCSDIVMHK